MLYLNIICVVPLANKEDSWGLDEMLKISFAKFYYTVAVTWRKKMYPIFKTFARSFFTKISIYILMYRYAQLAAWNELEAS